MTSHTITRVHPVSRASADKGIARNILRLVSSPRYLASLVSISIAGAVLALGSAFAADQTDITIPMDEREIRTAGIATSPVAPERGETELSLPGTVAIPPSQLRVVAAPANGLVEAVLVAADENVTRRPADRAAALARPRRGAAAVSGRARRRGAVGRPAAPHPLSVGKPGDAGTRTASRRDRSRQRQVASRRAGADPQPDGNVGGRYRDAAQFAADPQLGHGARADLRHRGATRRQSRPAGRGRGARGLARRARAAVGQHPGAGSTPAGDHRRTGRRDAGLRRAGTHRPDRPHRRCRDAVGRRGRRNRLGQRRDAPGPGRPGHDPHQPERRLAMVGTGDLGRPPPRPRLGIREETAGLSGATGPSHFGRPRAALRCAVALATGDEVADRGVIALLSELAAADKE